MALVMTMNNLSNNELSLDIKLDEDRAIREKLAVGGSLVLTDLAAAPTLDEMEGPAGDSVRTLIDAGDAEVILSGDSLPLKSATATLIDLLAGAADDVELIPSMPHAARLVRVTLDVTTNVALSTVDVMDEVGGGGNSYLTGTLSGASVATVEDNSIATIARGGVVTIRRSDDGVEGTLLMLYQQTSL